MKQSHERTIPGAQPAQFRTVLVSFLAAGIGLVAGVSRPSVDLGLWGSEHYKQQVLGGALEL
jgi:hypothetical protein